MEVIDPIPLSDQQAITRHQGRGGRMSLEDRALQAYHELHPTNPDEAVKQYFKILSNGHKQNSRRNLPR